MCTIASKVVVGLLGSMALFFAFMAGCCTYLSSIVCNVAEEDEHANITQM